MGHTHRLHAADRPGCSHCRRTDRQGTAERSYPPRGLPEAAPAGFARRCRDAAAAEARCKGHGLFRRCHTHDPRQRRAGCGTRHQFGQYLFATGRRGTGLGRVLGGASGNRYGRHRERGNRGRGRADLHRWRIGCQRLPATGRQWRRARSRFSRSRGRPPGRVNLCGRQAAHRAGRGPVVRGTGSRQDHLHAGAGLCRQASTGALPDFGQLREQGDGPGRG